MAGRRHRLTPSVGQRQIHAMFEVINLGFFFPFFFLFQFLRQSFVSVGELVGVYPVQRFPGTISRFPGTISRFPGTIATKIPRTFLRQDSVLPERPKVLINLQPYAASKRRECLIIGDFPREF